MYSRLPPLALARSLKPGEKGACQDGSNRHPQRKRHSTISQQYTLVDVHKSAIKCAHRKVVAVALSLWTTRKGFDGNLIHSFHVGTVVPCHMGSVLLAGSTRIAFLVVDGHAASGQGGFGTFLSGNCSLRRIGEFVADTVAFDRVGDSSCIHVGTGTPNGIIDQAIVQSIRNDMFGCIVSLVTNPSGCATVQLLSNALHTNAILGQSFHRRLAGTSMVGIGNILIPRKSTKDVS